MPRVDPLLDLETVEEFPRIESTVPRAKREDKRERRRAVYTPRRAAGRGFRLMGTVREALGRARVGIIVAFSVDGRQAYVRWTDDLANHNWRWLSDLEAE